jgi:hypothetical protein
MTIKLRVVAPVYWAHKKREPGDIIDAERSDFVNDHGEFETPR